MGESKEGPGITDPAMTPMNEQELELMAQLKKGVMEKNSEWERYCLDTRLLCFIRGYPLKCWKDEKLEVSMPKTISMLCDACEWWDEIDDENITKTELPRHEEWKEMWPSEVTGSDACGRCIFVTQPFSATLMEKFSDEEVIKYHQRDLTCCQQKKNEARLAANNGDKSKTMPYQHFLILDFYGPKNISLAKAKYFKRLNARKDLSMDQYYYPESLYKAYVVNTPMVFRAVWKVAQNFVHPLTRTKINVKGPVYLEDMLADGIPLEAIPLYMGGTAPNPKGHLYHANAPAGGEKNMAFPVAKGQKVSWKLYGRAAIKASVAFRAGEGDAAEVTVLALKKLAKKECAEGVFEAKENGKLIIRFDNSAAWVNSVDVACCVIDTKDGAGIHPPSEGPTAA